MLIQEIRARQALDECNMNSHIKVVHAEIPKTFIGDKEYTLVFPRSILKYGLNEKNIYISFIGKITPQRKIVIDKIKHLYTGVHIINSLNGRDLKKKVFDVSYYNNLGNSYFVLCPDGDFIWSYRFFEAILCNAIPIIENESVLYKDYKFYKLGDKIEYKQEWVDFNLKKIKREMLL